MVLGYQDDENYLYGMVNRQANSTQIFVVQNGVRSALTSGSVIKLNDNNMHWMEMTRMGDTVSLIWDGAVAAQATTKLFPTGKVGIGSYNDAVYFDQITAACWSNCLGKKCGDDGCGNSCGSCDDSELCTDDFCKGGACVHNNNTQSY